LDRTELEAAVRQQRWWVIGAGALMNLAFGSLYAWSVFVAPLERQFGWNRTQTSSIFTVAVLVTGFSFLLAGWINDRWGPRPCAVAGAVLFGAGFWLSAFTDSLTYLFICFGIVGGLGGGLGCAVIIPTVAKWFPDKRGLAIGVIIAAYGAGSAILGPVSDTYLIPIYGLSGTFKFLGVLFLCMTLAGAALIRNPLDVRSSKVAKRTTAAPPMEVARDLGPADVLRTSTFWFMWAAYALGCSAGLMVISQLVPFARSQGLAGSSSATLSLVIGAAGNTAGRFLAGWLSDTFGRLAVLRVATGASALMIPALASSRGNVEALFLLVFLVYAGYGTLLSVNAAACADFWGVRNAGQNYGLLFTAWGIAGVIGPRTVGVLYDAYHGYGVAFSCAGALSAFAFILELFIRRQGAV
jgi:OFA family oxalate/formate antiporter-like MFS transporter